MIVLFVGVAGACAEEGIERVRVCGDLSVPEQLDAVRVALLDEEQRPLVSETLTLLDCGLGRLQQLPVELDVPLVRAPRWLRVQALRKGVEVSRVDARASANDLQDLFVVNLSVACLGALCEPGRTCVDGSCVDAPAADDPRARCDTFDILAQPLGPVEVDATDPRFDQACATR